MPHLFRYMKPTFAFVFVLISWSITVSAQTQTTGAIEGQVRDEGAAIQPIAGATVKVRNEDNGLEVVKLTDAGGRYRVDMLPPGTYTASAAHPEYDQVSASTVTGLLIYLSQNNVVKPPPIVLRKKGATPAPSTAPTGAAPSPAPDNPELLINITNAARGGNFDQRQLTTLPLSEIRSFESLAFLLPGVAPPPKPIGGSVGPGLGAGIGTAGQFSVNGQRARSNNFTVDGSDNNDEDVGVRRQGFVSLLPQSVESVQEFQVFTHLWEAWVGRNLGSQVNAISQSGVNLIHGAVYGFFNHDGLNARNFFDTTAGNVRSYPLEARSFSRITGLPDRTDVATLVDGVTGAQTPIMLPNPSQGQDPYRRLQGGVTIGGPISKKYFGPLGPSGPNQTFFFGSLERQSIRARQESHFSVPTVAQRGFLGSGASGFRIPGLSTLRIIDVSTGAGRLIDTLPIIRPTFTAGDAVFSLFPFPNNPIGPYGGNTFTQALPANAEGTIFSFKLDHNFKLLGRDKTDVFTARYNFTNDQRLVPAVGGAIFSGLEPRVGTQNLSLFLTSQVTARLTNQIRGSYGRTRLRFEPSRDPLLQPSSLADASNAPFLLNQQRLLNISCSDFPGLSTTQFRGGCLGPASLNLPRNRYGFFSFGVGFVGTEPNLGPVGQVVVTPFSPVGLDSYLFPQGRVNNTYQIADTLSVFRGNHNLQFGTDIRRTQLNSFLDRNFRPQVIFGGTVDISGDTALPGNSRLPAEAQRLSRYGETPGFFSGSDLAALGISTGIFQALSLQTPNSSIGLRLWQYDFFFNDTWRLRRGLTFNYGLRYEYNTVPREANNRIERTFDLNAILPPIDPTVNFGNNDLRKSAIDATLSDLNKILNGRQQIYDPDRDNFGPHFGFAWDPLADNSAQAGKMVIRGGAGIYYDVALGSVVSQSRNVFPTFLPVNSDTSFYGLNLFQGFPNGYTVIPNATLIGTNIGNNGGSDDAFIRAGCTFVGRQGTQNVYGCGFIRQGTLNILGVPPGGQQLFLARILNPAGVGRPASGAGLAFTLPDRQLRSPQSFHFNLQVERELFKDFLVNVAYVGDRSLQLTRFRTPNGGLNSPTSPLDPLQLSQAQGGAVLQPAISRPPLSSPTRLSRPIAALGAFTIFDSSASSSYHSLQASGVKRFSNGWQLTAAYTWSHAIDDVSDVFDVAGAFTLPQDDGNLRAERGNANFDMRHRFVLSTISNVPFISRFNNAKGATGVILGGWQMASIWTCQSGQPFTINTSYDINGDGNLTDRPNTTNGLTSIDSRRQKLALTVRSTDLLAAIGQGGKLGRNTFRADRIINTDFTVIKNFRMKEGQTLVFRAEAFNLWNRPQFGVPVRILEAPSFGSSVDTALPARQVQLALKYVF